jgi:hypothetical protein
MPPTFLLYVLALALAAAAPVVAIGCLLLTFRSQWRHLGRRSLIIGTLGGTATIGIWFVAVLLLSRVQEVSWVFAAAIFGAGFSAAVLAMAGASVLRKVLSNSSSSGRESA